MLENAKWISGSQIFGCPEFRKSIRTRKPISSAVLQITALGVYTAWLDGARVGNFRMAPGWTVYRHRLQVQSYDVTAMLQKAGDHTLTVTVANGWYLSEMSHWLHPEQKGGALIAELLIRFSDGKECCIVTDESWSVGESKTRYADIYHGEHYDATFEGKAPEPAIRRDDLSKVPLIEQQGDFVIPVGTVYEKERIRTPMGESVIDFGQEITGVVHMEIFAKSGDTIRLTCGEMLDADGNFYNRNYRTAKSEMVYTCQDGWQCWEPEFTFYGFRYIRIEGIPFGEGKFSAVVLHSDIKRCGVLLSGKDKLNRLFRNAVWGQKGNFLDVPTDCPQRNERYGWTGDTQVFINTALWQFDCKRFFTKWLDDMMTEQRENGAIPNFVPDISKSHGDNRIRSSAAWGDAATVCPWELYRHYGDLELLRRHYPMMKKWVAYIGQDTVEPGLWIGGEHFGDWLGLDAPAGSYTGSSDKDLIASACYYLSAELTLRAERALSMDTTQSEALVDQIGTAFRGRFRELHTQTECALALRFGLTDDLAGTAAKLAELIRSNGTHLATGFVGTPHLLYALSENGYAELAYSLLLKEDYPSWLYAVDHGATTMWEHWDGIKPDDSFWSSDMNSFNHYAYGSFAGWIFEEAAGIKPLKPGFAEILIEPKTDPRLGWLRAEHETGIGKIISAWMYEDGRIRYEITVPVKAMIHIEDAVYRVEPGSYILWDDPKTKSNTKGKGT